VVFVSGRPAGNILCGSLKSDDRKQPHKCFADAANNQMSNKLYVGNLAFETMDHDLQDLFAEAGAVTDCTVMLDRMTSKSRGFGFVTMSSPAEAQEAIRKFSGFTLHGRPLTVNEARPPEARSGGGDRGGFGGNRGGYGGGGGGGGGRRDFRR
jgi:cold-inducible RNA-binding protein